MTDRSISDMVNEAVKRGLAEDAEEGKYRGSRPLVRRRLVDAEVKVCVVKVGHRKDVYREP